jgi:hypothetical protein
MCISVRAVFLFTPIAGSAAAPNQFAASATYWPPEFAPGLSPDLSFV